jgi:probable rRNA maturation factor
MKRTALTGWRKNGLPSVRSLAEVRLLNERSYCRSQNLTDYEGSPTLTAGPRLGPGRMLFIHLQYASTRCARYNNVRMSHKITVANPQGYEFIDRGKLRAAARAVLEGEGVANAAISLAFVDNPTIHRLNKQFLDHDEPTDVITFPLSRPGSKLLEGELVIGVEVGIEQAAERGHDVLTELTLYVIHGLLHLCGYDDHSERDRAAMREREQHYLQKLGLPAV